MRIGFNMERELLGRIVNIESLIERHFVSAQDAVNKESLTSRLEERTIRLIEDQEDKFLKVDRSLILVASPTVPTELRTLFSDKAGSIRRNLEDPPALRQNGWSLRTSDHAKLMHGEFVRVKSRHLIIDLYRDGTMIFGARVHSEFLAWSDKQDLEIHPLALIEFLANCFNFYELVVDDLRNIPEHLRFKIQLRNLHLAGKKNSLPSGPVGSNPHWKAFARFLVAPSNSWMTEITVSTASFKPYQVAFSLVHELYIWFGHMEESIPYVIGEGDSRAVDADQIANIG